MSKQITLFDIIADEKKKRSCDCWLDVGKCYCELNERNNGRKTKKD